MTLLVLVALPEPHFELQELHELQEDTWQSITGGEMKMYWRSRNMECLFSFQNYTLSASIHINFVLWSMCVRYYDRQVWKPSIWRVPGVTAVKISQISQTALSKDNEA